MRRGVRLGLDVGTVRIGVAVSDADGLLATPVETVARARGDYDRIEELVRAHDACELIVGLPRHLNGSEGASAADARKVAGILAGRLPGVPVRLVDERLSTVSATRDLQASGVSGRRGRTVRRTVIDQAAAVVILQSALDAERGIGEPPGSLVEPPAPRGDR